MAVAICIETPTRFARRIVADAQAIPLHSLLKLTDGNTAIITSGADACAGIAWEEKTTGDGITEIVVALNGRWEIVSNGSNHAVGELVAVTSLNTVGTADSSAHLAGKSVGRSLDALTGAGSIVVEVNILE